MMSGAQKKRKKILITGGAGFVGSTLIRVALDRGYDVLCIDLLIYGDKAIKGVMEHPRFELIRGDIRDTGLVEKALKGVDYVVHLAAIVGDLPCNAAPKSAVEINFKGTQVLAEASKNQGIKRFIFSSTCSNYGVMQSDNAADENHTLNPVSLYAETKIDCETFLSSISCKDFSITSLRFASAYGISFRTRFDLLINSFAYEAWTKNEITVFSGNTWRPYIHVYDMSSIIMQILDAPVEKVQGQIFNAGLNAQNATKKMLIEILKHNLPGLKVKFVDTVDDRRNYRVNFDKLENQIGFKSGKSIDDGIKELLGAFKQGTLTKQDFEVNKLETLTLLFKEKEGLLKDRISL